MKKFFKNFAFPIVLLLNVFLFSGYMAWKEHKIKNDLVIKALLGDRYATAILAKYKKPNKLDQRIVKEALQGNKYALEILNLKEFSK